MVAGPGGEDDALARRAARGDERAFAELVRRHGPPLHNFAYRMVGDADDAADVAQQAFVQAYLHLPARRPELPFRPWLFRIARNLCVDRIRQRRTVPFSAVERDDEPENSLLDVADSAPLPEEIVERRDLQKRLRSAVLGLPPRYRAVVALRYTTDQTFGEIAAALEIPENTAKTLFQRAKPFLRRALVD